MTELEFDVLDELYFIISFDDLNKILGIDESVLKNILFEFIKNEWVRCFLNDEEIMSYNENDLPYNIHKYCYLASKKGLIIHNQRTE